MSNERKESLTTKLASTPTGRRSFLRNSGIAALMAAGAMTVQPGSAAAQSKETVTSAVENGEIPEGARITKRMMRSLTVYNLGFMGGSDKDRAQIKEIALGELSTQFSQLGSINGSWAGYTPNPEDDDPWPWPWWWGRGKYDLGNVIKWGEVPFDAQLTVRLFDALTVYNQSFLRKNSDQQRKLQGVALGQIKQLVGKLGSGGGGAASWEDGDLCPPWWPWPWPPKRHFGDPEPETNLGATLDIANSIIDFHLGAAFTDGGAWGDLQRTAFDQMNQQLGQLRGGVQTMSASGSAMWEPGDDICPPWWPWPWPGPRRISEILDPSPNPWRVRVDSLKTTVGIFRSLTLVASAATFQDARAGAALQGIAVNQVGVQLEQLGKQIG